MLGLIELRRVDLQPGKSVINLQVLFCSFTHCADEMNQFLTTSLFVLIGIYLVSQGYNASDSDSDDLEDDTK